MKMIVISEAAELTGLNRQTIRNWIDKGIIPYNKINGTFYVDKDTFLALAEPMLEVEKAREHLEAEKAIYERERECYRVMKEDARLEHNTNRYLSICVNSGVRTAFFDVILNMLQACGTLKEADVEVLHSVMYGTTLDDIAKIRNTSRERIRQIAEKAIHKSRELKGLKEKIEQMDRYEAEITTLNSQIDVLKKMVYKQVSNEVSVELNENERRLMAMDRYELDKLFSKRLADCNLSVRTLNVLTSFKSGGMAKPIKTIGDLCKITRLEFLEQRNAGKKSLAELDNLIENYNLAWDIDVEKIVRLRL